MTHNLSFATFSHRRHANLLVVAGATFALGLVVGAMLRPSLTPRVAAPIGLARADAPSREPPRSVGTTAQRLDPNLAYPAQVLRVIDGDTFQARVRVWPGLDVDTKVRLRGIDAAELHARCADEQAKAEAARAALETILAEGGVAISRVGLDKYGGRVVANTTTRSIPNVSAELLARGQARAYAGGHRDGWCDEQP